MQANQLNQKILFWIKKLDFLNKKIGEICSWLIIVLIIGVFLTVILRYLLAVDMIWLQELMIYTHALLFISVAGYTLQYNAHVRVDVFYQKFNPKLKSLIDILGSCLFLIPVFLLLLNDSFFYFYDSLIILEGSQMSGGLPFMYVFKFFLLILPFVLIVQCVSQILKSIMIFRGFESYLNEHLDSPSRSDLIDG